MNFDNPHYLFLLVIPLLLIISFPARRRKRGIEFLAASTGSRENEITKKEMTFRVTLSDVFFVLFAVFIVISLSGPRWGTEMKAETRRGLDLTLAFDISRSMAARDVPSGEHGGDNNSRLERALEIARELCLRLDDVRYAVTAGKGTGVLMVPLTYDLESVFGFLDSLDESFLTGSGTNLESLLESGMGAFRDNMNRRRGIILFTDGEAHQGDLDSAVTKAVSADIKVSAAGLGAIRGAQIPVEKSAAYPGGVLLDPSGDPVISRLDEDVLRKTAGRAGGLYVNGSNSGAAAELSDFYRMFASDTSLDFKREPAARWHIFLTAGLVCLCLSRAPGFRRKIPHRKSATSIGLLCVFSFLISSCAPIQGKLLIMEGNFYNSQQRYNEAISSYLKAMDYDDVLPYAEYGLGLSYSAMDENEAALEQYAAAQRSLENLNSGHTELLYRIELNTGIIHFIRGNYDLAAASFRNALETDGSRIDAKRNLELSLLAIPGQKDGRNASLAAGDSGGGGEDRRDSSAAESAAEAMFDFLRQSGQEKWRNEWTGESDPVWPDY